MEPGAGRLASTRQTPHNYTRRLGVDDRPVRQPEMSAVDYELSARSLVVDVSNAATTPVYVSGRGSDRAEDDQRCDGRLRLRGVDGRNGWSSARRGTR